MIASRPAPDTAGSVRFGSTPGRWVLLAAVLGSGLVGIDATVVNVALPTIGDDLDVGFGALQWTITAYTLTLASLILLGGALGDRYGRKRIFIIGVLWFAAASVACGAAPTAGWLIGARALQGVGAALLTPGSLAIIQATFVPSDRARAIGAWAGLGGVATAIGPLVGGWLVLVGSWRWIFLINLPIAALVVVVAARHIPESSDPTAHSRMDLAGAALALVGLGGVTYAIIAFPAGDVSSPRIVGAAVLGVAALVGFIVLEAHHPHPMLPLTMFSSRQFSAANAVTVVVYAALGGVFLMLTIQLQVVGGYTPLGAGLSLLPVTLVMLALSARAGQLAQRIGPRTPMTVGPAICAVGVLMMRGIGTDAHYVTEVLPAVTIFGFGLAILVAPLTAAVLAAVDVRHAGVASGVNNAVARAAGLIAVAALPALAGISGDDYHDPVSFSDGYRTVLTYAAVLLTAGAVIAYTTIRDDGLGPERTRERPRLSCPIEGPPLTPSTDARATGSRIDRSA